MPEILTHIYPDNASLPDYFECQIRAFIRIAWFDAYTFDLDAPVTPEEWHPAHVVLADKHAVISYAGIVWRFIEFAGQTYKVYGLSSVFTYPAYRKHGYGRQVVEAATAYIVQQPDADLAILFTDPELEPFYGEQGWHAMRRTAILIGDKEKPSVYHAFAMMLFLSEKGKQAKPGFENSQIYFAEYPW
jgi:GNAT superfamily N-acetyltransferase